MTTGLQASRPPPGCRAAARGHDLIYQGTFVLGSHSSFFPKRRRKNTNEHLSVGAGRVSHMGGGSPHPQPPLPSRVCGGRVSHLGRGGPHPQPPLPSRVCGGRVSHVGRGGPHPQPPLPSRVCGGRVSHVGRGGPHPRLPLPSRVCGGKGKSRGAWGPPSSAASALTCVSFVLGVRGASGICGFMVFIKSGTWQPCSRPVFLPLLPQL